jgi:pimeloyl-ACP methyl ester carboxylesterase
VSPLSHSSAVEHVIQLGDGRRLGYAVYGDPDGRPVLNCHGGLLCRIDVAGAADDARRLGICLISPDRPGVGLSDRSPGHDTADWSEDVRELLDQLGIDQVAVMGWSLGGQYALAVAARLPERVSRTAVIAGCIPLDDPVAFSQLNRIDQRLATLSRRAAPAARSIFAMMGATARRSPTFQARLAARGVGLADRAVFNDEATLLARAMAEGLADTRGAVDEYRAMVAPWGYRPEAVTGPVDLWQGELDTLVPAGWATELKRRIPQAAVTRLPDEGHLIAFTHRAEVLTRLLTP